MKNSIIINIENYFSKIFISFFSFENQDWQTWSYLLPLLNSYQYPTKPQHSTKTKTTIKQTWSCHFSSPKQQKPKEPIQLHTLVKKTSFIKEKHASGHLLLSFASFNNLGSLNYAEKLFDTVDIPRNSLIMYTTMIKAYANFGNPKEAFVFYSRMLCDQNHVYPNDFTFTYTCLLKKHLKIIKHELTRNPKQPVVV